MGKGIHGRLQGHEQLLHVLQVRCWCWCPHQQQLWLLAMLSVQGTAQTVATVSKSSAKVMSAAGVMAAAAGGSVTADLLALSNSAWLSANRMYSFFGLCFLFKEMFAYVYVLQTV